MSPTPRITLKIGLFIVAGPFSISLLATTNNAEAGRYKLKCKGPYQIINGSLLATPPCEDRYIAKIARSYGYRVTAKQIGNGNTKALICTNLSHDTRIRPHCGAYNVKPSIGPR